MQPKLRVSFLFACLFALATWGLASDQPADSHLAIQPLMVGSQVPDTSVVDPEGNAKSLKEALDGKPTVLIFYRGSW